MQKALMSVLRQDSRGIFGNQRGLHVDSPPKKRKKKKKEHPPPHIDGGGEGAGAHMPGIECTELNSPETELVFTLTASLTALFKHIESSDENVREKVLLFVKDKVLAIYAPFNSQTPISLFYVIMHAHSNVWAGVSFES